MAECGGFFRRRMMQTGFAHFDGSQSAGTTSPEAGLGRVRRFGRRLQALVLSKASSKLVPIRAQHFLVSDCSVPAAVFKDMFKRWRNIAAPRRVAGELRQLCDSSYFAAAAAERGRATCLCIRRVAHGREARTRLRCSTHASTALRPRRSRKPEITAQVLGGARSATPSRAEDRHAESSEQQAEPSERIARRGHQNH